MTPTILLPPSKGMTSGGDGPAWHPTHGRFGGALASARLEVADTLERIGGGDGPLLGLKDDRLAEAAAANTALIGAPTVPAWRRYTGVVYDALDAATLPDREPIVVVSALLGLVGFDDPVPEYRLAGGKSLPGVGPLWRYWRERLEEAYALLQRPIFDLTSDEYRRLLPDDTDRVQVDLVRDDGGRAGHWGKVAKGNLVRAMVESPDDPIHTIETFEHRGLRGMVVGR